MFSPTPIYAIADNLSNVVNALCCEQGPATGRINQGVQVGHRRAVVKEGVVGGVASGTHDQPVDVDAIGSASVPAESTEVGHRRAAVKEGVPMAIGGVGSAHDLPAGVDVFGLAIASAESTEVGHRGAVVKEGMHIASPVLWHYPRPARYR